MAKRSKDDGSAEQRHSGGTRDRRKVGLPVSPRTTSVRRFDPRYVEATPVATGALFYTIKPTGLDEIERLAREGLDIISIAKSLGIRHETFLEVRKRQPEAQEALNAGRAALGDEISNILLTKARNGETAAAIFLAKGRLGWREVGPTDPNQQAGPTVNITITAPMGDDEFARMIAVDGKRPVNGGNQDNDEGRE